MTEPTDALLPCPWCKATDGMPSSNGHESHMVVCSCGAEGPPAESDSGAIAAWNRGTPQPTQTQAGAVPQYRLLHSGVDRIEDDDEFLSDDTTTWAIDPNGIFSGNIYGGHVLRPARRRIKGGQHGDAKP